MHAFLPVPLSWDKEGDLANAKRQVADIIHTARDAVWGTGCVLAVAGGAARDIAHNAVPKDIDLVVLPNGVDDVYVILSALEVGLGYRIEQDYRRAPDGLLVGFDHGDYDHIIEEGRWSRVVKLVAPGRLPLDVLVSTAEDLRSCVQQNDFNINHYLIRRPALPPLFVGSNLGTLVQTRTTEVSPERAAHVQQIAINHGWSLA